MDSHAIEKLKKLISAGVYTTFWFKSVLKSKHQLINVTDIIIINHYHFV